MSPISDLGKTEIIESAKTLFGPAGSELGQMFADRVRFWRWRSAIKIMKRAAEIRNTGGLNGHKISLKFFLPFIEEASKENEESDITELWANLLASSDSSSVGFDLVCLDIIKSIGSDEAQFLAEISQSGKEYGKTREFFMEDMIDNYETNKDRVYQEIVGMAAKVYESYHNIECYFTNVLRQVVTHLSLELKPYVGIGEVRYNPWITHDTDLYKYKLGSIITLEKLGLIGTKEIKFDFSKEEILVDAISKKLTAPRNEVDEPRLEANIIVLTEHGRGFVERCTRKDDT